MFFFVAMEQGANRKFCLKLRKCAAETYEELEVFYLKTW
jgi:hypothetical protein